MSKYELSITDTFVEHWGFVEGVRELLQNAVDQETMCPENTMLFNYDDNTETLYIGNKTSILEAKSLLLGNTTKAGNDKTIGSFGEGYKLGTLALIRAEKKVTFYNYGKREIWRPRFVNSRRYQARVLTFFTEKQAIWKKPPNHDLMVTIENVSLEEYEDLIPRFLMFIPNYEHAETTFGEVLLNPDQQGQIFVNGLYIAHNKNLKFGYNFKPRYVKVGRDRNMVNDFDIGWYASASWSQLSHEPNYEEIVKQMLVDGIADVEYITNHSSVMLSKAAYDEFKAKHGTFAIPVTSQKQYDEMLAKYPNCVPIFTNAIHAKVMSSSITYSGFERTYLAKSTKERLLDWIETVDISRDRHQEFMDIVNDIREG